MEQLDLDAPPDVIAVARHFTGAATTVASGVAQTTVDLVPHHRAESPLDHALVAKQQWITTTFGNAVAASARRADATLRHATKTANALGAADTSGGNQIDRYESI
jgi:hypothetical protein